MSHRLKCGDVVPGCAAVFEAETKDELLGEVAAHAEADHGISEIDAATRSAIDGAIETT